MYRMASLEDARHDATATAAPLALSLPLIGLPLRRMRQLLGVVVMLLMLLRGWCQKKSCLLLEGDGVDAGEAGRGVRVIVATHTARQ